MQRSPYSRETTDISDQELRQILESENISGLPAPYCLVPHYDGQVPLPPNTLWHPPSQAQQQQQQQQQQQRVRQPQSAQGSGAGGASTGNAVSARAGSSSSNSGGEVTRRRTRTTLTPYQLRVLFRVWERTQYPSSDLRLRLATNLMMTPRNVQIWFQNQRQKTKERAEMRRRTHSPSSHSGAISGAGVQRQLAHPLQQHPLPRPHQQQQMALSSSIAHPGAIAIPRLSPPESPFRYTHGPPPPPPAIPAPPGQYGAASSMPARHPIYYHDMASAPGAASSLNPSPVPGASSAASPPALFPPVFSHPQPPPPPPASAQNVVLYPSHRPRGPHPAPGQALVLPPPPHVQRGFQGMHQRHASQPHAQRFEDRGAAVPPPPSAFTPSDRSTGGHGSTAAHIPPPAALVHAVEHHRAQLTSTPSPLASMSSLSMESPKAATRTAPPSTQEQPADSRVQLAQILNPVAITGPPSGSTPDRPRSSGGEKTADSQLGPLPSLGTVLANVQSESAGGDSVPKDSCAPTTGARLEAPDTAPATAAAGDKWRPW